mmetsp:Transcript_29739/g.81459  ORF Transcript_29739/g.81459 Transcript_29739/m.81459 type:complete len:240 (+) Transcript_29739:45-764(+)|eukprot:CAMPEP_0117513316 /NCGR_PEP_ID=MMETSP0784-20121206/29489_1 /TAXON_ID=39447 /ORGANISM="" /LENGTH=239 /DNA_ID=CAMNT_0005309073 /DNA_START=42 /DNA_END=761 /DNA_ORIENTATION=+
MTSVAGEGPTNGTLSAPVDQAHLDQEPPLAVIFDVGGVLAPDCDLRLWLDQYEGDDARAAANAAFKASFDRGKITPCTSPKDIWVPAMAATGKFMQDWRKFDEAVQQGFTVYWEVLGLVDRVKRAGFRVGLISNHVDAWFDPWFQRFGLSHLFSDPSLIVVSSKAKVAKPDPAIFDFFFEVSGLEAHQCVFVDDKTSNLESARRCGMRPVVFRYATKDHRPFDSIENLYARLASCGVIV